MIVSHNFEFRLFIDESDRDLEVWVYEFEIVEACGKRTVCDWVKESFFDLVDPYEDFKLDEAKPWQVIGRGNITGHYDYVGEYEEHINIIEFKTQELPSDYNNRSGEA